MLLDLLLTLNIVVCLALIGVVLLQRSEGGALGGGGGPTGLVTTRGAGDLLTRTTWVLFGLFLALSLALTLVGGRERSSQDLINRLKLQSINPDLPQGKGLGTPSQSPQPAPAPNPSAPAPTVRLPGSGPASTAPSSTAPSSAFSAPAPVVSLPPMPNPSPSTPKAPKP
jgi:preprotein translocase subunit SecG